MDILKKKTLSSLFSGFGEAGLHTTARELQMCTFEHPGASNTTTIPRTDRKEREERKKIGAGEGKKKARNFEPPTFGAPPFGAPTLRAAFGPPGAPSAGLPKISFFFFPRPPQFSFSSLGGPFVEFWCVYCVSVCGGAGASHDSPRTPNVHISGPEDSQRDTKSAKWWRERKKSVKFCHFGSRFKTILLAFHEGFARGRSWKHSSVHLANRPNSSHSESGEWRQVQRRSKLKKEQRTTQKPTRRQSVEGVTPTNPHVSRERGSVSQEGETPRSRHCRFGGVSRPLRVQGFATRPRKGSGRLNSCGPGTTTARQGRSGIQPCAGREALRATVFAGGLARLETLRAEAAVSSVFQVSPHPPRRR